MLVLTGSASIADVVALADRREQVSVSARVVEAVDHAHRVAADLSTRFAIYGRTTGVGANRTTSVSPTDTEYGMRLLRSHAVDAGDPLDDRTVRAMLAVRLAQLCVPGAGLDPKILSGLEAKTPAEIDQYLGLIDEILDGKRSFMRGLFKDAVGPVTRN